MSAKIIPIRRGKLPLSNYGWAWGFFWVGAGIWASYWGAYQFPPRR